MSLFLEFKKIIKANDVISDVLRYFYIPVVISKKIKFDYQANTRLRGKRHTKYDSLKKFKNIHRDKRCFIVATGPSLTIEDMELIKDEYTFSMNSIYVSYKKTVWRPTYYVIQDSLVYEKICKELNADDYEAVFIGSTVTDKFRPIIGNNIHIFPLDLLWQQIPKVKYHTKFSNDIFCRIYSGYTVAYSALQIAVYMGFTEIYLLGADCNYMADQKYFAEDKNRGDEKYFTKRFYEANTDKFVLAYKVAKDYAEKNNINIYNATRGGCLEVYPRVNLNEVIGK